MDAFDPVSWDTIEGVRGPPAAAVTERVEAMASEIDGEDPYVAVKAIHDALATGTEERSVSGLADPFITAYLLEQRGVISADTAKEYDSLVDRRPSTERLRELFWEEQRTLWWIGVVTGVHPSLVTYWCYEDDIPLMERNITEDTMEQIREVRGSESA